MLNCLNIHAQRLFLAWQPQILTHQPRALAVLDIGPDLAGHVAIACQAVKQCQVVPSSVKQCQGVPNSCAHAHVRPRPLTRAAAVRCARATRRAYATSHRIRRAHAASRGRRRAHRSSQGSRPGSGSTPPARGTPRVPSAAGARAHALGLTRTRTRTRAAAGCRGGAGRWVMHSSRAACCKTSDRKPSVSFAKLSLVWGEDSL